MLVTDYDILISADGNGYARDFSRAYHDTIVWEPKKRLVPLTGTTIPVSGTFVIDGVGRNLEHVTGVTIDSSGVCPQIDLLALWVFDNGKLKLVGADNEYLADEITDPSVDTHRDVITNSTGVTIALSDAHVSSGEVYPTFSPVQGVTYALGVTANGPDSQGQYTVYGPMWYKVSAGCYPSGYLQLYSVEDIV